MHNITKTVTEVYFGFSSDGKEGGSDGKEGSKDTGYNEFVINSMLDIKDLEYAF